MGVKEIIAGGVVTLVIGGTAYTVNQQDVVNNFANDTGLSEQQASEYVNSVKEEDLVEYDELGQSYIDGGNEYLSTAESIDCDNYEYEWQTSTLPCPVGKQQLAELGRDEVSLGESYIKLSAPDAQKTDINKTISLLSEVNANYALEIAINIYETTDLEEITNTNSYNKALLEAALQSEQ